jgi:hypothetical protein
MRIAGAALTGPARQLLLCGVASLEGCDERMACVLDCLGRGIGGELRLDRFDARGAWEADGRQA